jgi:DNA-binding CsgD family transcriptional regulator
LPALDQRRDAAALCKLRETAATCVASLTSRQRQILNLVLVGHPSKNIAADLGISQRTVDNHPRGNHEEDGSRSLPALIRTAIAAARATRSRALPAWLAGDDEQMSTFRACSYQGRRLRWRLEMAAKDETRWKPNPRSSPPCAVSGAAALAIIGFT